MTEPIRVTIKKTLQKLTGSLKKKIPVKTVPTAPIPVHTAYAVPIGKVWVALISRSMLTVKEIKKPANQKYMAVPLVSFTFPRHDAKATSNNPAIIKIIQFIFLIFCGKGQDLNKIKILQLLKNENNFHLIPNLLEPV